MRQAAHAALQCDPTRGDAQFYATIHRIMGRHKQASIAAAHRWLEFAPKNALAHFWVGATLAASGRMGDATVYLQQAAQLQPYATLFRNLVRSGAVLYRSRGRRSASPAGNPRVRPARLSSELLAWVCWRRTHAGSTRRGMRPPARIRCLAARKRSPRWATSRRHRNLSSRPRPSCTPSRIPITDTSRAPVSARSTLRLDVSIAPLESGPLLRQKETGNWAGRRPTRVGMPCAERFPASDRLFRPSPTVPAVYRSRCRWRHPSKR